MQIQNARWSDETREFVMATIDGEPGVFAASEENRHFARLLEEGAEIGPPPPPQKLAKKTAGK